jgi:hypothetical protein
MESINDGGPPSPVLGAGTTRGSILLSPNADILGVSAVEVSLGLVQVHTP